MTSKDFTLIIEFVSKHISKYIWLILRVNETESRS